MVSAQVQEFLDREARSWAAFDAQVSRVSEDRRETPGCRRRVVAQGRGVALRPLVPVRGR